MNPGIQQPIKQLILPKSAVESITEFRQIRPQMFRANPMIGPGNKGFGIADEGMHPSERLTQVRLRRFHPLVRPDRQALIGRQSIGANLARLVGLFFQVGFNRRALQIRDGMQVGKARMAIGRQGQTDHDHGALGAAPPFVPDRRGPKIGVIHCNQAGQLILGIAVGHYLADLVEHGPRSRVREGEFSTDLGGRNTPLVLGDQANHPEPHVQRCPGAVKQSPGSY